MDQWQKGEKDGRSTLTQPVSLELISLWTLAGVTAGGVHALILAHVTGETAFVDVCTGDKHICANVQQSVIGYVHVRMCVRVFTLAGDCVLCQLIALVTLAEERTDEIVAEVLAGTLHITFVHIWEKSKLKIINIADH